MKRNEQDFNKICRIFDKKIFRKQIKEEKREKIFH